MSEREGVSNESGYFEDDDESGSGLNQEDSIEIIFDKNASNNNSADQTGRRRRVSCCYFATSSLYYDCGEADILYQSVDGWPLL